MLRNEKVHIGILSCFVQKLSVTLRSLKSSTFPIESRMFFTHIIYVKV